MDELEYREIGERIRETRLALNLTQEEASERCDLSASFYGNIERGDKKMSLQTLVKIARGLSVSTETLLFGVPAEKSDSLKKMLEDVQRTATKEQFEKFMYIAKTLAEIIDKL